jgi:hypothetical protein
MRLVVILLSLSILALVLPTFSCNDHHLSESLKEEYSDARVQYDFDMVKNPFTGKIPEGVREAERTFARSAPRRESMRTLGNHLYFPAGPDNFGGRTRAVAYDIRYDGVSNKVIIAGSVSGGILRSADGGNTWQSVAPDIDMGAFCALAQDTRPGFENVWYAGGGEYRGHSTAALGDIYLGYGLLRSIDNGVTWMHLPMDNIRDLQGNLIPKGSMEKVDHPFDYVNRITVNPTNGDLYVAGMDALLRSTDGGNSFRTVAGYPQMGPGNIQCDVAIAGNYILFAMNGDSPFPEKRGGVWISTSGEAGSWKRIAGGIIPGTDLVTGWRASSQLEGSTRYRRILLAVAPSDPSIVYIAYLNLSGKAEVDLFKLKISGSELTWSNLSGNLPELDTQFGYTFLLSIKPDDPDFIWIGGTYLFYSTDGFSSNKINMIRGIHADVHTFVYDPSDLNSGILGDDGGLEKKISGTFNWTILPNYQTFQYYNVSIDPSSARNNFLGGTQDNGTKLRDETKLFRSGSDTNEHVGLQSGDGGATGISKWDGSKQFFYFSSQYGAIYRMPSALRVNILDIKVITPNSLSGSGTEHGEFVTNFKLDPDNTEDLYYVNFNRLFRTTSASTVDETGWTDVAGVWLTLFRLDPSANIRAMALSRGPYTSSHSLFFGTTRGQIFRLDDPRHATSTSYPVMIGPPGMQGIVQDIAVNPNDDNEIMAVVSNYGVTSIWWTNNAKLFSPTWKNAEGNLTAPSIRSCAITVKKDDAGNSVAEYFVGTSVGLYSTENLGTILFDNGTPTWMREGGNILNYAVVQSLAYRPSDNILLIGTHGNGMYYTQVGTPDYRANTVTSLPTIDNDASFIKSVYPTLTRNLVYYKAGKSLPVKKLLVQVFGISGQKIFEKQTAYTDGSVSIPQKGNFILVINSIPSRYRHLQKIVRQ